MRNIIKDRRIVADHWQHVAGDEPLPDGPASVSWPRWKLEREALRQHEHPVGVRLDGDVPVEELAELAEDFDRLDLIGLEFPVFKDGRCYTHARLLRERYGYRGELRALGDVLRDQVFYMHRVGIDAFEMRPDRSIEDALSAFEDFSLSYQAAADQPERIDQRRAAAPRAAAQC